MRSATGLPLSFGHMNESLASFDVVLLDMDGVVRHWRPDRATAVERDHGLPDGFIYRASVAVPEDQLGVRGECTFADWLAATEREVAKTIGRRAHEAVTDWAAYRGDVDLEMLDIVRQLRSRVPVHVLSNAHDCFMDDMRLLGLDEEFDGFHYSAELGVAKPDRAIYLAALERIGLPAHRCLFTDDRPENVAGASAVGMTAFTFTTPAEFAVFLAGRTK